MSAYLQHPCRIYLFLVLQHNALLSAAGHVRYIGQVVTQAQGAGTAFLTEKVSVKHLINWDI